MKAFVSRRETNHPGGPLQHAVRNPRRWPGRSTLDAACSAQVAREVGDWDPKHARACGTCRAATR